MPFDIRVFTVLWESTDCGNTYEHTGIPCGDVIEDPVGPITITVEHMGLIARFIQWVKNL